MEAVQPVASPGECPWCRLDLRRFHAGVWPIHCVCGATLFEDYWESPPQVKSNEDVQMAVATCLACPHLRDHQRAGLRCTHRNCRCGQGEQSMVELLGRVWNGGLVNRIRAGRCPDGRW